MDCAELAVSLVVVFHYARGQLAQGTFPPPAALSSGWTGVDLFLCFPISDGRHSHECARVPVPFPEFLCPPLFRIVPIYYLWIVFYIYTGLECRQLHYAALQFRNSAAARPRHFLIFSVFADFVPVTPFLAWLELVRPPVVTCGRSNFTWLRRWSYGQ